MRRLGFVLSLLAAACLVSAGQASAKKIRVVGDDTVPLISGNVSLVTTLPVSKPVGVRFRDHFMYVTGLDGLRIFDVADPEAPQLVGALPLPHFENEDVDLAGDTLLISNDPSEGLGILYVIDISDPALPILESALPTGIVDAAQEEVLGFFGIDPAGTPVNGGLGHTASCVNTACSYAYLAGSNRGIDIVDLRDPAKPAIVKRWVPAITGLATHDVQVDGEGLAWIVGYDGTAAYDVSDPVNPKLVKRTTIANSGGVGVPFINDGKTELDFIHHDSLRLGDLAGPADPKGTKLGQFDTLPFKARANRAYPAGGNTPVIGIVEEDYTRPTCEGAGSFQTWKIGTTDSKVTPLDSYATELNNLVTGRGVSPVAGMCSAHYFDYRDGIVAAGWYEEGTRLLDVRDPSNIRQIGYWVPPKGMTWSAAFPPTDPTGEIFYSLDITRGIDVMRLDRKDLRPREAPVRRQWLANTKAGKAYAAARAVKASKHFGWACRLI
jgi:hypothetical protein